MAKRLDSVYAPNKRTMLKIKHERDCDCVVAGFRWHKDGNGTAIGSLLLGLLDDAGALQHVGVCSSFTAAKRKELVEFLEPYRENALEGHPWAGWAEASVEGADAGWKKPMDERKGLELGCGEAGTGGRSGVRAYAGRPVPAPGALSAVAD